MQKYGKTLLRDLNNKYNYYDFGTIIIRNIKNDIGLNHLYYYY